MIGVIHPTATALIPRIGGAMIITQIIENITIATGVPPEITGIEVTLTIQATVNTGITEVTEIPVHIGITEVIEIVASTGITADTESVVGTENMVGTESMVGTGNMGTTYFKGGQRCTPPAECPPERRIGPTPVNSLWRGRLSSIPRKLDGPFTFMLHELMAHKFHPRRQTIGKRLCILTCIRTAPGRRS